MKLQLNLIAARLEGLEETIISKLIDRAQYKLNAVCYEKGKSGITGEDSRSLLEIRLYYQEEMDSQFGRYRQPEERPFNKNLPPSLRDVNLPENGLALSDYNVINVTDKIMESYLSLVKYIAPPGDDKQYGSSVVTDVYSLQAIAERIHFGALYVAESKYQDDPEGYTALIRENNTDAIMEKLTRKEVEERILLRVQDKVAYHQAKVNTNVRNLIQPEVVLQYYRDYIIPLTKVGEVKYLMNRKSLSY